jgi:hypothetical protein
MKTNGVWKYKGGGFLPDVPAHDLTAEEAKRYGVERIQKSGFYSFFVENKKSDSEVETESTKEKRG